MTSLVYALATVLYAAARAVQWCAEQIHREAHRRSIAAMPTARTGNRPRSLP